MESTCLNAKSQTLISAPCGVCFSFSQTIWDCSPFFDLPNHQISRFHASWLNTQSLRYLSRKNEVMIRLCFATQETSRLYGNRKSGTKIRVVSVVMQRVLYLVTKEQCVNPRLQRYNSDNAFVSDCPFSRFLHYTLVTSPLLEVQKKCIIFFYCAFIIHCLFVFSVLYLSNW